MAIQSFKIEKYDYGCTSFTGIPTQPKSINVFIKSNENGKKHFRQITLIPSIHDAHSHWITGIGYGIWTIHEAIEKSKTEKVEAVIDNLARGALAILPIFGRIGVIVEYNRKSHHFDKINNHKDVKGKIDIAGAAVDGNVIWIIPLTKVDLFTKDLIDTTNERRLKVLSCFVQHSLRVVAETDNLHPVDDVLKKLFMGIDKRSSNERNVQEIEKRIECISKAEEDLNKDLCIRLTKIGETIESINEVWYEKNKPV